MLQFSFASTMSTRYQNYHAQHHQALTVQTVACSVSQSRASRPSRAAASLQRNRPRWPNTRPGAMDQDVMQSTEWSKKRWIESRTPGQQFATFEVPVLDLFVTVYDTAGDSGVMVTDGCLTICRTTSLLLAGPVGFNCGSYMLSSGRRHWTQLSISSCVDYC